MAGGDRDPDAGLGKDLPAAQTNRLSDLLEEPGRDVVGLGPIVEILKQHHELVPADACGRVGRT